MWRDRTNLFISYRQSYSHHPAKRPKVSGGYGDPGSASEERRGLMSAGAYEDNPNDVVIEMDVLQPRWLDIQDEVSEYLSNIAIQTKRLDTMHQKHILPGFEDEDVKKKEERDIEALTQEITRGFGMCQRSIKRIDKLVAEAKKIGGGVPSGEEAMARNLKISLATRVGDVSAVFRKKQSAYLKKLQAINGFASPLDRSSTPLNSTQTPYNTTSISLLESESDRQTSQSALQRSQTQQQKQLNTQTDAVILQREREIESIAQGVIELANIFQELQTMVIDQGSMLDRIDYNVERMASEVKGAEKELKVATNYQRRSVKRKVMLLLLLLIVGAFILLGLKLGSRGSSSSSSSGGRGNLDSPADPAIIPPPDAAIVKAGDEMVGDVVRRSGLERRKRDELGDALLSMDLRRDWRRRKRWLSQYSSASSSLSRL